MSGNNPNFFKNPDKIKYPELYRGIGDKRLCKTIKNLKNSLPCLAITGAALLGAVYFAGAHSKAYISGQGQGGDFLTMRTLHSQDDISYNREFQKARALTENAIGDGRVSTSSYLLADLGIAETNHKSTDFVKRAPHKKYY